MISDFVESYGYLAVFAGTLLEGETILIAAGFAAHRGLLDWPIVVLVALAGATLGDQCAFLLGRWKGEALIARFPALARRRARIHELLERHDRIFILTVRFIYGLRIAGPLILGSSRVPMIRFMVFNVMGAAIWSVVISGAGYSFGLAVTSLIADVKRIEGIVLIVILAAGAAIWLWRRSRARRRDQAGMKGRES